MSRIIHSFVVLCLYIYICLCVCLYMYWIKYLFVCIYPLIGWLMIPLNSHWICDYASYVVIRGVFLFCCCIYLCSYLICSIDWLIDLLDGWLCDMFYGVSVWTTNECSIESFYRLSYLIWHSDCVLFIFVIESYVPC